jgi:hypothetical protein
MSGADQPAWYSSTHSSGAPWAGPGAERRRHAVARRRRPIIDPDIANTNGPAVGVIDGSMTSSGLDRTLLLPVTNPTDVTFGGPSLGRLYVVSIGSDANNLDGALLIIDGLDTHGRAEPRCTLDLPLV